ncbi:MAG: hypothetical protein KGM47_07030 [Acidobacteriota bacterium]|nr:hypothetical protein [Acidobacteriota bacterium]
MISKKNYLALMVGLIVILFGACGNKKQTATQEAQQAESAQQQQPAQPGQAAASGAAATQTAAPMASRAPERAAAPAPPPKPKEVTYTIAAGAPLHIRLDQQISSGTAVAGSPFSGTLSSPLTTRGVVVVPAGSAVSGVVAVADKGGRLHSPPVLALRLTSLEPTGGRSIEISTSTWSEKGKSQKKRNLEVIGGGAGLGALVGALAGRGKGAAIGAAVGAGAGTAGAAFTGHKQIVLPAETPLRFVLAQPFSITRRAESQ